MDLLKQLYGSNYLYKLREYQEITEDGLPKYVVNFSEYPKWGINPFGKYFPNGIYFYFLHPDCFEMGATGSSWASDRLYANIGRINHNKFAILKNGNKMSFNKKDRLEAIKILEGIFGKNNVKNNCSFKYRELNPEEYKSESVMEFSILFNIISCMAYKKIEGFNKLLHIAGYDGILDLDNEFLPIEKCQGVQTWAGAVDYIESIKKIKNIPYQETRLKNSLKRLSKIPNGSLKLSTDDFFKIVSSFRKSLNFNYYEDSMNHLKDFVSLLIQKMDISKIDFSEDTNDRLALYFKESNMHIFMFDSFDFNPTTPIEFWKQLRNCYYEDVRFCALDKLGLWDQSLTY